MPLMVTHQRQAHDITETGVPIMKHRHYTTQKTVMAILLVLVAVLAVLDLTWKTGPEPDVVCPMTNAKVSWENTYYPGPWEAID